MVQEQQVRQQIEARSRHMILLLQLLYVGGLSVWAMTQGIFPSVELIFILILSAFVWQAKHRAFVADFFPFVLLLLSYQALRGFADDLSPAQIHILDLVAWERAMWGGIVPASYLQAHLLGQPYTPLLNVLTNAFYMSHYIVPLLIATLLWHQRRDHYWPFTLGLIGLSFAGFVTYILFPAAPPWWAHHFGYLPDDTVILTHFVLPTMLVFAGPNPVAAMPSLHAAYPCFIALYCVAVWGSRAWPMLGLPLAVGFSAVYLGHHYVVDLLAGYLYAIIAFALVQGWCYWRGTLRSAPVPQAT